MLTSFLHCHQHGDLEPECMSVSFDEGGGLMREGWGAYLRDTTVHVYEFLESNCGCGSCMKFFLTQLTCVFFVHSSTAADS